MENTPNHARAGRSEYSQIVQPGAQPVEQANRHIFDDSDRGFGVRRANILILAGRKYGAIVGIRPIETGPATVDYDCGAAGF